MTRVLLPLLIFAFTLYTAVDCIQTDESRIRHLPKLVWLLLILFFPLVAGIAWLYTGREPRPGVSRWGELQDRLPRDRGARPGQGGRPMERGNGGRPIGPDDDPDFLKGL